MLPNSQHFNTIMPSVLFFLNVKTLPKRNLKKLKETSCLLWKHEYNKEYKVSLRGNTRGGDTLPNRIRERREQLGLTQTELANKLKLSISYLSKIENEKTPINVKLAIRIARALKTTVEEIFFD